MTTAVSRCATNPEDAGYGTPFKQRRFHVKLLIFMEDARILSYFLPHLDWEDFYSVSNSCKGCRSLFDDLELRDVILSRYVPWYRHAITLRDPLSGYKDVPLSLKDLDLLRKRFVTSFDYLILYLQPVMSQRIPLHQYPIHARRMLTSSYSREETTDILSWLQALTQAYSKFVLLLQAYVHSSNEAEQVEPEDMLWMSHFMARPSRLRKLTFPAPLAYSEEQPALAPKMHNKGSKGSVENVTNVRHSDDSMRLTKSLSRKRKSIGQSFVIGTETSRKSWARSSMISQLSRDTGYASDDCMSTYPTHPRDISIDSLPYSYSASGSSRRSPSRNSLAPFCSSSFGSDSGNLSAASPSFTSHSRGLSSAYAPYPMRMTSPLDLSFAVSRTRAPILRAFVPCSQLEDDSQELLSCEQQLIDTGLWDHLSTGDIICNLGYVPPTQDDGLEEPVLASSDGDPNSRRGFGQYRSKQHSYPGLPYNRLPTHSRKWLLFNGQCLVTHKPPDAFRLPDPLGLPTPFYYMHIMPPYSNPVFVTEGLGLEDAGSIQLETRLVHSIVKVRSPHSPTGYALVRKYAWTACVLRSPDFWDPINGRVPWSIGRGWTGEWVLEGEGTKEGREALIDCILGKTTGPIEWEVVVDRCGGGRVWLRLLNIPTWTKEMHTMNMVLDLRGKTYI